MAAKREYNESEEKYFTSYQKHKRQGRTTEQAKALAARESGTTPKMSWVGKLKGGVKKEMEKEKTRTGQVSGQLKKAGLTDEQIKRLKG